MNSQEDGNMEEEAAEYSGASVAACGSTRCKHNDNLKCTAEKITISKGGDCATEKWRE
jgi:hypothetical protein